LYEFGSEAQRVLGGIENVSQLRKQPEKVIARSEGEDRRWGLSGGICGYINTEKQHNLLMRYILKADLTSILHFGTFHN